MVLRSGRKNLDRRLFLGGGLALAGSAAIAAQPRLAAIDWAMLETALALGLVPIAACELLQYRATVVSPPVPIHVQDLGLRGSPNLELLQMTRPDLILSSPWYSQIAPRLQGIAPVLSFQIYNHQDTPWARALQALHVLDRKAASGNDADRVAAAAVDVLEELSLALQRFQSRPMYIVDLGDARYFRAFGADSMFGSVLALLGLENAWPRPTEFSFAAPVPIERLAERPDAWIVAVSGIPIEARAGLKESVLWNRLDPVRHGRVVMLPTVNAFGGVPAGLRFARLLAEGLTRAGAP